MGARRGHHSREPRRDALAARRTRLAIQLADAPHVIATIGKINAVRACRQRRARHAQCAGLKRPGAIDHDIGMQCRKLCREIIRLGIQRGGVHPRVARATGDKGGGLCLATPGHDHLKTAIGSKALAIISPMAHA